MLHWTRLKSHVTQHNKNCVILAKAGIQKVMPARRSALAKMTVCFEFLRAIEKERNRYFLDFRFRGNDALLTALRGFRRCRVT